MDSKGVLVAEALTDVSSMNQMQQWPGAKHDYFIFRTDPMKQLLNDFGSDLVGFPTLAVIDLQTMEVLRTDCYNKNWENCVGDFL